MIDASARRLLVFREVVDLGGFNAAAMRLGIAQPSVGAHINALEAQVGQSLLVRHRGARPQLTEAGRIVYELASQVVRLNEAAGLRLANLKASQSQEVVIAAHRDLAVSFLPQRLSRFAARHRRSRVVTRIGTIEDVLALVESGAVQLGVLLASGPLQGLKSEVVGLEPMHLVVGKAHPLARRATVGSGDLKKASFVTGLRNSRYFGIVEAALQSIGLKDYQVALELQESVAVKEVVRQGQSIACLPRCTIADELVSGALVILPVEGELKPLEIRCVYKTAPAQGAQQVIAALRG